MDLSIFLRRIGLRIVLSSRRSTSLRKISDSASLKSKKLSAYFSGVIFSSFGKTWKGLADEFASAGININGKVDAKDADQSENTLKGAFSKASQESITLLSGQFGAMRVDLTVIKDNTSVIRELQAQGWNDVRAIKDLTVKVEQNTNRIAGVAPAIHRCPGRWYC